MFVREKCLFLYLIFDCFFYSKYSKILPKYIIKLNFETCNHLISAKINKFIAPWKSICLRWALFKDA